MAKVKSGVSTLPSSTMLKQQTINIGVGRLGGGGGGGGHFQYDNKILD